VVAGAHGGADKLNRRFGRDTVRYAAAGVARRWTMQRGSPSPRYTTSWDELLSVAAAIGMPDYRYGSPACSWCRTNKSIR
jgi:hypothetical protein